MFYTSLNSMSVSLLTIFLSPAYKIFNNVSKNTIFGVYCFQYVRDSVIPEANKVLQYNFDSFCPVVFNFISHLSHQARHV